MRAQTVAAELTPEGDLFTQMPKCSEDVMSCGDGPMWLVQQSVCVKCLSLLGDRKHALVLSLVEPRSNSPSVSSLPTLKSSPQVQVLGGDCESDVSRATMIHSLAARHRFFMETFRQKGSSMASLVL